MGQIARRLGISAAELSSYEVGRAYPIGEFAEKYAQEIFMDLKSLKKGK